MTIEDIQDLLVFLLNLLDHHAVMTLDVQVISEVLHDTVEVSGLLMGGP